MSSELVEIQPSMLMFQFELRKQMSCLIQLTNKTENFVGFKLPCKDKFLIESTIVPFGLTKENITSEMFVKDPSKHIEEKELEVILVAPTSSIAESPVSLPSNGIPKQDLLSDASLQKDEAPAKSEKHSPHEVLGMMKKPRSWLLLTLRRHNSSFVHSNDLSSPKSLTVPLLNNPGQVQSEQLRRASIKIGP